MSDLQELFARLKAQAPDGPPSRSQSQSQSDSQSAVQPSIWAQPEQQRYQQPLASSALFSPPTNAPNPPPSANIISPASTLASPAIPTQMDQNKTNNLLNLLKFNNQAGQAQPAQSGPLAHLQSLGASRSGSLNLPGGFAQDASAPRPLSAQDLMASLQRHPSASAALPSPLAGPGADRLQPLTPSGSQQDFLLNLLKKPNVPSGVSGPVVVKSIEVPSQHESSVDKLAQSFADASIKRDSTPPVRHFGSPDVGKTAFEAPQPTKPSLFSYQNPFEQLHASSPLNRTPRPDSQPEPKKVEILKHSREVSAHNGQPSTKSRRVDGTTPESAGVDDIKGKSVSEAVEDVGEKVGKQVEKALAQADAPAKMAKTGTADRTSHDSAFVKKETAAGDDDVESSWESAEDSANEKKNHKVKVYNFPMKPFVSITIIPPPGAAMPVRQSDNFITIAQAKKDFDQMDRCLVTASQTFIVYAQLGSKKDNCGFRILRQDTGTHKQVFRSSGERIFSVQMCSSATPGNDVETVLGTGVNGSVFWTGLAKSRPELFQDDDVEQHGFIMPAVATAEEAASGSTVKTRAKCSSRHPEYFAMSRGKTIHIISPEMIKDKIYTHPTSRKVNSEKYLLDHGLRINTGKAGKDFCFSEDDSMIVSLDKSGTVKFWDVRDLANRVCDTSEGPHEPVELKEPMWILNAVASNSKASEKPSVSSIMLLDKERPHIKSVALRYMLVGFKQNHILQLWDLGLNKPVQELRLPHKSDADGICSIAYHPKTGIIAIGHPTRNCIYFVHLSAPKYNIPLMDQARYVSHLARNEPSLPKPESTAIMSGLREFSFDKVGTLRSLDMLRTPVENASEKGSDDETLFELYIMHSKGTVCLAIKRTDLGWNSESKMVNPVDAVKEGVVEVEDLNLPVPSAKESLASETSSNAEVPAKRAGAAAARRQQDSTGPAPKSISNPSAPSTNGSTAQEKGSMQIPEAPTASQAAATNPPLITPDSYAIAAQRGAPAIAQQQPARDRIIQDGADASKKTVTSPKPTAATAATRAPEDSASATAQYSTLLSKQFTFLFQRLDNDKRVSDAAGSAKQDAVLRLVSSTLTENVERSLSQIVGTTIEEKVIPSIVDSTSKIVDERLASVLPGQVQGTISKELKSLLPGALQHVFKEPSVQKAIAETTANQMANKVQQQVSTLLQQSLPNMAQQATQKMVADLETRLTHRLHQAEAQHQQDNIKIEELSELVRGMSQTLQGMASGYAALQEQMLSAQLSANGAKQAAEHHGKSDSVSSTALGPREPQLTPEEQEVNTITDLLVSGKYNDATIAWVQSARQAELFDQLFVRVNPQYLQTVAPLVALSVCAVVTATFDTHTEQRLTWLGTILSEIDVHDPEIVDVAPKIMDVLSQRLQGCFIMVSERSANDPLLRMISGLSRQVAEVRRVMG